MDGYEMLAGAIIAFAAKDYYKVLSEFGGKRQSRQLKELESFFCSEWFEDLAFLSGIGYNGEKLMGMVKEKVKEDCT